MIADKNYHGGQLDAETIISKFYVFGGGFDRTDPKQPNTGKVGTTIWCFDAVNVKWSSVGKILRPRVDNTSNAQRASYAATMVDGSFLIAGDKVSAKDVATAESCSFDPNSTVSTMVCTELEFAPISFGSILE